MQKINEKSLSKLQREIRLGHYENILSLIVFHKENKCFEHYFSESTPDSLFDIRSAFKSITSLLLGICIDSGLIFSVNDLVKTYFFNSRFERLFNVPAKKNLKIVDLLTMRSGLDCEEFFNSNDREEQMELSHDWVDFCFGLPISNAVGNVWSYCTCNAMIIGAIIEQVSKMDLASFAEKNLFDYLGIKNYRWTKDPSGNYMAGGSFFMKANDMLKIGQLILNKGKYKSRQLISSEYINLALSPIVKIDFSFVQTSRYELAKSESSYYGLFWYTEKIEVGGRQYLCKFASGNGGQYILIVYEIDLVVVCTQKNFDSWRAKQFFEILIKFIIPSLAYPYPA